ncbi:hypothetical protein [Azotobacter beijerinckii]|uniref:hypothetical protein n=1 Tax=Azotobacter beijerinckii TaxID=170623 RepID=UPI00147A995B
MQVDQRLRVAIAKLDPAARAFRLFVTQAAQQRDQFLPGETRLLVEPLLVSGYGYFGVRLKIVAGDCGRQTLLWKAEGQGCFAPVCISAGDERRQGSRTPLGGKRFAVFHPTQGEWAG